MNNYLAFDIGGTHIKYGIVNENGEIIHDSTMDTEAHLGGSFIINKVIEAAKIVIQNHQIAGVAISTAGQVNIYTGTIVGAGDTIPDYEGLEIKRIVSTALQLPVEVSNDVNCVALCEKWKGNHQVENFITLTIGTGVGGAIIINNELYTGHTFSAGEWGYMRIEGEPFEKVASISGLIHMAKMFRENRTWTGKEIFALYDRGDSQMKLAVEKFYRHLAIGISNLIYIFNPEKVIIGGGITGRGEQFLQEVKGDVQKYAHPSIFRNTEIVLAKFSNHSGMIGAAYHFMERQKSVVH
ncbi:ROK family protein [Oceanobacillus arenosus]|uniref:ROK family protein n=1 Tax=Oceanobacillus arenosus TaxID=1229153 RepID=A0A3D8Q2M9_9BACI|nr:ROK family protein [Oceanobacillus arenosus]RDW22187.1 ROK family protein [Oceanobacillus arenosus]